MQRNGTASVDLAAGHASVRAGQMHNAQAGADAADIHGRQLGRDLHLHPGGVVLPSVPLSETSNN